MVYPDLRELVGLQNSIQTIKNFQGIGKELEALREIGVLDSLAEVELPGSNGEGRREVVAYPQAFPHLVGAAFHRVRQAAARDSC